jgi:hypothetical protein
MKALMPIAAAILLALAGCAPAATLVDRWLADYEKIQSVVCEVRKDSEARGYKVRTLSRVFYERPDRLNVENVTPVPRRIVADGTNFCSYAQGDRKGFMRPVAALDEAMLINLRKVPGSAMEHLLRLRQVPETNLAVSAEFPVRKGYQAPKTFVVVSADTTGRLARIEFFEDATLKHRIAQCTYSQFQEALPGVWLAGLHETVLNAGGVESRETSRYLNLTVNGPVAPSLFNPRLFFKDVEFVASFEEIYK